MRVTLYPKNLLLTILAVALLGVLASLAADVQRGVALGIVGGFAYVLIEVVLTVNPAAWWPERWAKRA